MNRFQLILRRVAGSHALLVGVTLFGVIVACAVLAGFVYPDDPRNMVGRANVWPGSDPRFPLGTDMLGRDLTAATMHAARISLLVGVLSTLISAVLGILIGATAGYFGGWVDDLLMRFTEIFLTMPRLLLTIAMVVVLGPSTGSVVLALGLTSWPTMARLVRAEALRVRQLDFVHAATTFGMGHLRIILRYVLPHTMSPAVIACSVLIAQAILAEASLSFLGLGDPSVMSWGGMVGAGRSVLRTAWYMTLIPGLAIVASVMAFMLLGNGLNDVLNPKSEVR
ncbi:ABC transporter permease [Lampropedia puyangensis]|uniref:ABC transporter permease n=1 Tax=Lampropedia puyangensis TaxID=1330072 RepID=A0A4S8ETJ2_9BURK|nr:ABC transporter permease [Lampropedia puyangensis]THT98092.1 ABC transporter permease [Lampropedia puyangensis]